MKFLKNNYKYFCYAFIFVICFYFATTNLNFLKEYSNIYYINDKATNGITYEEAYLYQEKQNNEEAEGQTSVDLIKRPKALFWNIEGKSTIEGKELQRKVETEIVPICGNSSLLINTERIIDYMDKTECIIGGRDAYELFGGLDVKGLEVIYNGKEYTIVDVVKSYDHIFIYQGSNQEVDSFGRISLEVEKEEERIIIKNNFESRYYIEGYMENTVLIWILKIICATPFICVLYNVYKHFSMRTRSSKGKLKAKYILGCGSSIGLTILLLLTIVKYPIDMIPPSWSEFQFWNEMIKNITNSVEVFIKSEKSDIGLAYVVGTLKTIAFGGLALAASLKILSLIKLRNR